MNLLRLIPEEGGAVIEVDQDRVRVGRDPASDIHLRDASISRQHAEIFKSADDWIIADLGSSNGIAIDGVRVSDSPLVPGQRLQLGNVGFQVAIERGNEDATVIFARPPVVREGAPVLDARPRPSTSFWVGVTLVSSLAAACLGLAIVLYLATSRRTPPPAVREAVRAVMPSPTVGFAPSPPAPVSAPPRAATPLRSILLISTDTRAEVWVDGRRSAIVRAGELRRAQVSPGEHIVSFRIGDARHDRLVHANPGEQVVARYAEDTIPGASTLAPAANATPLPLTPLASIGPDASPDTAPVSAQASVLSGPQAVPSLSPAPLPTSSPAIQESPSLTVSKRPPDEGLLKGAAENARGDFYRAVLTLKDVAGRLEEDPLAARDLALTRAHLAWTYHALNREAEAEAAVESALRADPGIVVTRSIFPAAVVRLFVKARQRPPAAQPQPARAGE